MRGFWMLPFVTSSRKDPLAHCEPVTLLNPLDVAQRQVQDTTPKIPDVIAGARPNLSAAEFRELEVFLTEYGDILAMKSDDHRRTDIVYQRTDTREGQPIHQAPRRLPLPKQK
jgi:hypothetical protein